MANAEDITESLIGESEAPEKRGRKKKFSEEQVIAIRKEYLAGHLVKDLAVKYKTSLTLIYLMVEGKYFLTCEQRRLPSKPQPSQP